MRAVNQAEGFVLAGGRSSRMARDKALVSFAGVPLIRHALTTFKDAGFSVRIAGARSNLSDFASTIPDEIADAGPLNGVCAALAQSTSRWNIFLPVDMPLLPGFLLERMVQRAIITESPATTSTLGGVLQPFPVVLDRAVLCSLMSCVESGITACRQAWLEVPKQMGKGLDVFSVESATQSGRWLHPGFLPPLYWFQGANTPRELARLESIFLAMQPYAGI